jgi:uncharacterized protein involved in outer membrane biogenesis
MKSRSNHIILKRVGIAVAAVALAVVCVALLFDWNRMRAPLAHLITRKTGRFAAIDGNLGVRLLSWTPGVTIEGLKFGNPTWAERPLMLDLPKLTVRISLLRLFTGHLVITELDADSPRVDLERDPQGRASWDFGSAGEQQHDPRQANGAIPAIQQLDIEAGKIRFADRVRKLDLTGDVSANERRGAGGGFMLNGAGSLNAKPFHVQFSGSPLLNVAPDNPYSFDARIQAGDIEARATVRIQHPFDLTDTDAKVSVSGRDLANQFYLTGLALPNTPPYRFSADIKRAGTQYQLDNVRGELGHSDISGELHVDTGQKRPKLTGSLESKALNFGDLAAPLGVQAGAFGVQAETAAAGAIAGTAPKAEPPAAAASATPAATAATPAATAATPAATAATPAATAATPAATAAAPAATAATTAAVTAAANHGLLLPDADLQLNRVRGMDADVRYRADSVVATPAFPLHSVRLHVTIDDGLLRIDPLSFILPQGEVVGAVNIDARGEVPQSSVDLKLSQIDLGEIKNKSESDAPLGGTLAGRVDLHGPGASIHKFASNMDGTASFVIPSGNIRDAIAELTGINVAAGLGLLITKDQKQSEIRCGVANFVATDGVLDAKTLVIDTSNVLITGHGDVNFGKETLDLQIQGKPKHVRLVRLRTPIVLGGSLSKPTLGVAPVKLLEQAGEATALGILLTPVAAILAFVDPGLAKNANCAALTSDPSLGNTAAAAVPAGAGRRAGGS